MFDTALNIDLFTDKASTVYFFALFYAKSIVYGTLRQ